MENALRRAIVSFVFLGLGGIFLVYALFTVRIANHDAAFQESAAAALLYPELLVLEGNRRYYVDLNADAASGFYQRAVLSNPLLINAWLALAEVEMARGREEEGRRVLETLAPFLGRVSTWKWQELLLAYEIRDESYFQGCFNFVLLRLPQRVREACYLARDLWGGWTGAVPHVSSENREVYLKELISAKEVEAALDLWTSMIAESTTPSTDLQLRFCEFLLNNKRIKEAKDVWKIFPGGKNVGAHDGGFEEPPLARAFGWRLPRLTDVTVERSLEAPYEGSYCMHVRFNGSKNVAFNQVCQIVPIDPGTRYRLSFARRSRNLTTDQGVSVEVSGYGCSGLAERTESLSGTSPWKKDELLLSVPEACDAIVVRLVRKESLKLDSKISGDYWLDSVSLTPLPTE